MPRQPILDVTVLSPLEHVPGPRIETKRTARKQPTVFSQSQAAVVLEKVNRGNPVVWIGASMDVSGKKFKFKISNVSFVTQFFGVVMGSFWEVAKQKLESTQFLTTFSWKRRDTEFHLENRAS